MIYVCAALPHVFAGGRKFLRQHKLVMKENISCSKLLPINVEFGRFPGRQGTYYTNEGLRIAGHYDKMQKIENRAAHSPINPAAGFRTRSGPQTAGGLSIFSRVRNKERWRSTMTEGYVSEFPDFRLNANPDVVKRWREIFRSKQHITVPAHAVIAEQGKQAKNLYYIESGLVEYTYIDRDGKCNFLEILGDHCVFPLQPMFGNNAMVGTFSALETCTLDVIGAKEVYEYLRQDSDLAFEFLAEFGRIAGGHLRQIGMSANKTSNRVEQVLCLLAEYRLKYTKKGDNPVIGLSQIDLARISKTTRVTVTKVLSDLRQKHIIETTYGGLIVTDLDELYRVAHQSDPHFY